MANSYDKGIACIGWGSLVHSPGQLQTRGTWRPDGPLLPVEFARESLGNRITLVICPGVQRVRTYWTLLDAQCTDVAAQNLALREYPQASPRWVGANVGCWDGIDGTTRGLEAKTVAAWAVKQGLAAVVWTNLSCRFNQRNGVMPTGEQVIAYLRALTGEDRKNAEEYVRKAPPQIDTPYRRLIAKELGWTYRG